MFSVRSCVRMRWISRIWSGTVRTATVARPITSGTRKANRPVRMPLSQPLPDARPTERRPGSRIAARRPWLPPKRTNKASADGCRSRRCLTRSTPRETSPGRQLELPSLHAPVAAALLEGAHLVLVARRLRRVLAGRHAGAHAIGLARRADRSCVRSTAPSRPRAVPGNRTHWPAPGPSTMRTTPHRSASPRRARWREWTCLFLRTIPARMNFHPSRNITRTLAGMRVRCGTSGTASRPSTLRRAI